MSTPIEVAMLGEDRRAEHARAANQSGYRSRIGIALTVIGLLVMTKVFDRAPAILREDFGISLPGTPRMMLAAWEEGFEALIQVLVGLGVAMYLCSRPQTWSHRYLLAMAPDWQNPDF